MWRVRLIVLPWIPNSMFRFYRCCHRYQQRECVHCWKYQYGLPLHWCCATKYFVLLIIISITYSEYVFVYILALLIQHANFIFSAPYCFVICGLSVCTIFSHIITRNDTILGKKSIEHKKCVLFFYTFTWSISHLGKIERDIVINIHRSSCKVLVIDYYYYSDARSNKH